MSKYTASEVAVTAPTQPFASIADLRRPSGDISPGRHPQKLTAECQNSHSPNIVKAARRLPEWSASRFSVERRALDGRFERGVGPGRDDLAQAALGTLLGH